MYKRIKNYFTRDESPRSSIISLVIVNLFPVYGILFWGWEIFPIMFLFWSENVVVGFFNIMRMLACRPEEGAGWLAKAFLVPFFTFHYGMFTAGHGVFVIAIFGQGLIEKTGPNPQLLLSIISNHNLDIALLALFISHGFSFYVNYIRKGEYRTMSLQDLMMRPYKRIVVLHITLIAGGFLVMILRSPLYGLLLFILLKTSVDLMAHHREHRRRSFPSP